MLVALPMLAGLLAGCESDKVPIDAATPAAADDVARCRALVEALPDTVADQLRRPVDPDDALGAAWGDPAITLTCGGEMPQGFDEVSPCDVANGVGWYADPALADDQTLPARITTVEYSPIVSVSIPATYRPEGVAAAMAELAPVVRKQLRLVRRCS